MPGDFEDGRGRTGTDAQSAPPGVDVTKPSPARIYDVYLGGKDNFAADRAAAKIAIDAGPDIPRAASENRAFLGRAVRFAIEQGIRQFIDIGTGLPTLDNVHEVAQRLAPESRVVYVDNDPIVLAHARALLPSDKTTRIIQADMREPETILTDRTLRELIDLDRPVAVLMVAVLHFATDEQARYIVDAFRDAVVPGSYMIVSHSTADGHPDVGARVAGAWDETESKIRLRGRDDVRGFFDGLELVDPGVVWVPEWHPDDPAAARNGTRWMYAGVARRP